MHGLRPSLCATRTPAMASLPAAPTRPLDALRRNALLWLGLALLAAGVAAVIVAVAVGARGEPAADAAALPVAALLPPLPRTTPTPGELRGVQARFFKLMAAAGEAPLALPDPSRLQVLVEVYDAAGALVPGSERQTLWGPAAEEGSVPWIAADLRRERTATRVVFSGLDARISRSSPRACLQVLDAQMKPLCEVPFGGAASQRVAFDLEGPAAQGCAAALRKRQETPLSELLADDPVAMQRVFGEGGPGGAPG